MREKWRTNFYIYSIITPTIQFYFWIDIFHHYVVDISQPDKYEIVDVGFTMMHGIILLMVTMIMDKYFLSNDFVLCKYILLPCFYAKPQIEYINEFQDNLLQI